MKQKPYIFEYIWFTGCPLVLNIHAYIQEYPTKNRHWPSKKKEQICCQSKLLPPPPSIHICIFDRSDDMISPNSLRAAAAKNVKPSSLLFL